MSSRELKLRRGDTCVECEAELDAGVRAWWDADAKAVTCLECRDGDGAPAEAAEVTVEPPSPPRS